MKQKKPKQAFFKSFFFLRIETVSIDFRLGKDVAVVKDTEFYTTRLVSETRRFKAR